jgi:thiol peroxidase
MLKCHFDTSAGGCKDSNYAKPGDDKQKSRCSLSIHLPSLLPLKHKNMATITLGGNLIHTSGELPALGSKAPDFKLTASDLSDVQLSDFAGQRLVLNIFPSIETGVCAASVRRFNQEAASLQNAKVLNVSRDLPFAHKRFCAAEGIEHVLTAAEYKDHHFGEAYGVIITSGKFAGLLSRAVVIIDAHGQVVYSEQVPEIGQEPNYEAAMAVLKA